MKRAFDPLYRVLYRELSSPGLTPLRDAFEDFLHEHWWGLVCGRNRRLKQTTIDRHPRVSMRDAAALAGIAPSVARHMLQAELVFGDSATWPSGRKARAMRVEEVNRMAALASDAVSLEAAAARLGLPERRVRDLIDHGELTPLVSRRAIPGAAAWVISAAALTRLTLESAATSSSASISVRDFLRYGRLTPPETVSLVRAVTEGELLEDGSTRRHVPIGEARLDRSVAWAWLRSMRSSSCGGMSVDDAAKALGLKQEVGYALVRAGLLRSSRDDAGSRRVQAADVESFRRAYVSLRELARDAGTSPRAALGLLDARPIAGPGVDANRQYFFRRLDLACRWSA